MPSPKKTAFAISYFVGLGLLAFYLAIYWLPLPIYALTLAYGVLFFISLYFILSCRGRWRDAFLVMAAIWLGLGTVEVISIQVYDREIDVHSAGLFVPDRVLGWGPGAPGAYFHKKTEEGTHRVLFDVTYTIDRHLNRKTISADNGPTVAFFSDSMTFGWGLPDSDTLPQAFADLTGRKLQVLNLAEPGFGPEQFVRALELHVHDDLLRRDPRLFVFLTAPWQAERSSCRSSEGTMGPSYDLEAGVPVYKGFCYSRVSRTLSAIEDFISSTSTYQVFFRAASPPVYREDIDLYMALLIRAGQLAREKYGVPTLILYLTDWPDYVKPFGLTDQDIMQRLRDGGLQVISASIDQKDYPGQPLIIPGEEHPTALANRIRAKMVLQVYESMFRDSTVGAKQ